MFKNLIAEARDLIGESVPKIDRQNAFYSKLGHEVPSDPEKRLSVMGGKKVNKARQAAYRSQKPDLLKDREYFNKNR